MGKKCKKWFALQDIVTIVIFSLGIGMLLVIFIPFWVWMIIIAACLLGYACWRYYND